MTTDSIEVEMPREFERLQNTVIEAIIESSARITHTYNPRVAKFHNSQAASQETEDQGFICQNELVQDWNGKV